MVQLRVEIGPFSVSQNVRTKVDAAFCGCLVDAQPLGCARPEGASIIGELHEESEAIRRSPGMSREDEPKSIDCYYCGEHMKRSIVLRRSGSSAFCGTARNAQASTGRCTETTRAAAVSASSGGIDETVVEIPIPIAFRRDVMSVQGHADWVTRRSVNSLFWFCGRTHSRFKEVLRFVIVFIGQVINVEIQVSPAAY